MKIRLFLLLALMALPQAAPAQTHDPCTQAPRVSIPISITTSTKILSGVQGKKNYLCTLLLVPSGPVSISVVEGTGALCGTNTKAIVGSTTAANGMNIAAGQILNFGVGLLSFGAGTSPGADVCILSSSGTVEMAGAALISQY